jgi:hypothetical protein
LRGEPGSTLSVTNLDRLIMALYLIVEFFLQLFHLGVFLENLAVGMEDSDV